MANAAVELMAEYLGTIRDRRLYPHTSSRQIREQLDRSLPAEGTDFEQLLDAIRKPLLEFSRHNGHPRMFGYVQAPGTAIAAIADLLASTLNANLTAWRSAPAAVEMERLTIDWIKQIVGFDPNAAGLFVSGGSMANMAALAAARRAKAPPEISNEGAQSCSHALRVYASEEVHHSIVKAAALLGIGRDNVRMIGVDERYKINLDALVAAIEEDRAAEHLPICVVANAGTVATGAFDPLAQISEIARRYNLWLHVDAAYGGFAALAPTTRPLFTSIAKQIRSRSIHTNGFIFRSIAAASCIAILKQPAQRLPTRRNTLASSDKRPTKLLHFGITDRSCRAAFVHSKSGCC